MGTIRITSGTDVAAPADRVWDLVTDFARNPEWQGGMRSCTWLTEPPVAVGSRYQQEAGFLGRTITTTFEVVALDRPGMVEAGEDFGAGTIGIASVVSTFPLRITRMVVATPAGCRVTADVAGEPDGVLGLLSPVVRPLVQRSVDRDYARLRALVEGLADG